MNTKDIIKTYYSNAREYVKLNNPKAARAYVLAILNFAVKSYEKASTILLKARTQAFLDRWIAVSRELYDKGVTDFVLECFALPTKKKKALPKAPQSPSKPQPRQPAQSVSEPKQDASSCDSPASNEIDIAGLIDETAKSQGWCADVFEKNRTAIVGIYVSNSDVEGSGTGFIISEKGYLLTNDHVVYDEDSQGYYPSVKMSFFGSKKKYKLSVLVSDKKADVALCCFNPDDIPPFTAVKRISDYSQVLPGASCVVIGNAFGQGLAPFEGIVRFTENDLGNLVYTAPSNPGDSGAPVFNRLGECIGINKSKTLAINNVSAEGYANATPMNKIDEILKKWSEANGFKI